jgi:hypothetical protein
MRRVYPIKRDQFNRRLAVVANFIRLADPTMGATGGQCCQGQHQQYNSGDLLDSLHEITYLS